MKIADTYNIINDVVCKKIVDNDLMKKIIVQVNDEGLCVISTRSSQTDSDTVFGDGYCGMDDIILYGISSDMRKMVVVYYHINNTIWNNRDEVLSIQNRDLPDYVLDAWGGNIRGRTTVALNQQQLDGMTGSMNDMHNPQSAALWQDFGTRAGQFLGGQEYLLNQGNLMGAQQFSAWRPRAPGA